MRKQLVFLAILFASLVLSKFSFALVPLPKTNSKILGQSHFYTVTFRGNGEAVVSLKIIFSNLGEEKPITNIDLRVPRVEPKDLIVFQVIGKSADNPEYYYGANQYEKAKFEFKGDTISITLPQPVGYNSSGSISLNYRATGYTTKNLFGAYKYNFETLKIDDKINSLQIGINTDSDLYLRGAKGKVEYRLTEGLSAMKAASPDTSFQNNQLDQYYQQIGYGQINKTASNLMPLESYTVTGSYADSQLALYGKELLSLFVITVLLALAFIWGVKLFLKKTNLKKTIPQLTSGFDPILLSFALSFVSSLAVIGYTIILFVIASFLTSFTYYSIAPLLMIIIMIISVGIYSVLTFLPALFVGIKKGTGWGVGTFVMTIFWLVFYSVIIFFVASIFNSRNYPQQVPVMRSETIKSPSLTK